MQKAIVLIACAVTACHEANAPLATAEPGVVFTYPIDGQLDVPLGARIVVTFANAELASAASAQLVGPAGVVGTVEPTPAGTGVQWNGPPLVETTHYDVMLDGTTLFGFTTRASRPRASDPKLVAVNGAAIGATFRPFLDTSTVRLLFSEPLDPRSIRYAPGSIELIDASGALVPATLVANGIHVSIDPTTDLAPGAYMVRLGNQLADLDGHHVAGTTVPLSPLDTAGTTRRIPQTLRTRSAGDAGPKVSRSGATPNVIEMTKPLIGRESSTLAPSALHAELGDPKSLPDLGNPIPFTIRRGARLSASGLDVKLDGNIPSGLSTGDIQIEILTDADGRLYRNPYQPAMQRPENANAPLYVDLALDLAIYAKDPKGNAVLAQTVLGVQATGTAIASDGVLAIETVATMELGLLGIAVAPTNFVMELVTDPEATVDDDTAPPALVASYPTASFDAQPVGAGIELIFDEPIDLARAAAGGLRLLDDNDAPVDCVFESHGSTVVVRPRQSLLYGSIYKVEGNDVADLAGNAIAPILFPFETEPLFSTDVPLTVSAIYPGVPCAMTNGHCAGGADSDDVYKTFHLAANESVSISFTQPVIQSTIALGAACNTGSLRIEETDGNGACIGAVPGTFVRDRTVEFVPDVPWTTGQTYRVSLVSGTNQSCAAGELCGINSEAASFDPLNGTEGDGSGGAALVIDFTGEDATKGTFLLTATVPFSDVNGSGFREGNEPERDDNRAALQITGTTGDVGSAQFDMPDCVPSLPGDQACMYLQGAMPVVMGELATSGCPGGAAACIPVGISPQAMYATSVTMTASVGISISTDTGTTVMRIREPPNEPLLGYIVDGGSGPKMIVSLDLYMDAPDMAITLSSHDLHSKPLSVDLEGPVTFLADGRISIALANTADVPVVVNIDAPLGISGAVEMIVPAHEMKLSLVSPPIRGVER